MADIYKGLTVKLGVDDTSLSKALRSAKSAATGVHGELKKIEKALNLDPGNTKLLAQQQTDYRKQISSTEKQLKLLKQAESEIGKEKMTSDQWTKLQSDIVMTEQKLKGYKQALTEAIVKQGAAESLLGKVGSKIESFGTYTDRIGAGMQTIGRGMTATVTPAIIAAGAATIVAATTIDTSLTNVKKTVNGTEEQYQALKASAVEFSKTNAVSASQILDIQALGAQLGFAIDELDMFGQVVSGLDIATNMDAETAATQMAQFANITKLSHDQVGNYGSAIVGLGNDFATTESDISAMAMRLAAAGTQVGMNQADILGLATALSSLGVEAEAGGSAVSTVMSKIDVAVATNSSMLGEWAGAANMSAEDFSAAWKNSPVEALSAVLSGMEAATQEGSNMNVILGELGITELRQTDNLKRMAGNSDLVARAVAKSNEEWSKNTALQNEVDNRNQSLAAKFEMLKNRVIAVADQVGGPLAEALLDALDAAEPLFEAIADGAQAFSEMDKDQQKAILTAVAMVAALGPLLTITGKVIGSTKEIGSAINGAARFVETLKVKFFDATPTITTLGSEANTAATKTDGLGSSMETTGGKAQASSGKIATFAKNAAAVGVAAYASAEATRGMLSSNADAQGRFDSSAESANNYANSLGAVDTNADGVINASDAIVQALDGAEKKMENGGKSMDGFVTWMGRVSDSSKGAMGAVNDYFGVVEDNVSYAMKNITSATTQGWGAALAATQSTGGELSQETKDQALAMCEAMNQLPSKYQSYGDEAMRALASSMAPYWPELENSTSMSAQQIAQVIKDKMSNSQGMHDSGTDAIASWNAGFSEGTQQVITSASEVTGKTIEQLKSDCEFFGFEGDAAVNTYATALANGSSQAQAAALVVGDAATVQLDASAMQAGVEGGATGQNYADSMAAKREAAVAAALQVTGMTIEQFNASAAQAGIEGDEATAAYAASLGARAWDAQNNSSAVAGAGVTGLDSVDSTPAGTRFGEKYTFGIGQTDANPAGFGLAEEADGGARSKDGSGAGENFASGFVGEIGNWFKSAWDAGWGLINSALGGGNSAQDARSPARKTGKDGIAKWYALGFIDHLKDKRKDAYDAGKGFVGSALSGSEDAGKITLSNYVSGVRSQIPELKKAMNEVSAATAMSMASPERMRIATTIPSAARKAKSPSVNVSVQGAEGITKAEVYDAMVAAMASSSGSSEVALYVDGRQLSGAIFDHVDMQFGVMKERRIR